MDEQTINKRDKLISHFGSIEKYQEKIFHKVPPIFIMVCDENGNVGIDTDSVAIYIQNETSQNHITVEQLIKRDQKTFSNVINEFYLEVFL